MTTIEKLFAQIFDRKCHIINQAKQQADSFSHHLASKLLIDGVTPPRWLWNPSYGSSSDPKEFNKEDLLSELLLPHPRPTVANRVAFCSLYNHPIVLEENENAEARIFGETNVSNKDLNLENGAAFVPAIKDNEVGSATNAPDQDVDVTTSAIITYSENREASKGSIFEAFVPNIGYNAEDKSTPLPNDIGYSLASSPGQNEMRNSSNIAARDQSLSRLQRSKSRQKALELRKTAEKVIKTHPTDTNVSGVCYEAEKIFSSASNHIQPYQDGESLALAKYSENTSHMYVEAQASGESRSKEKGADLYSGRITRSRNSSNLFMNNSKSKLEKALDVADGDGGREIKLQNNGVEVSGMYVQLSNAFDHRITRSKSGSSRKFPLNLDSHEKCDVPIEPSSEIVLCSPDRENISEQKAKTDCLDGNEVILDEPVKIRDVIMESNLSGAGPSGVGLEDFESRPSSNCRMIVEPKTLKLAEIEKTSAIKAIIPFDQKKTGNKSFEKICESTTSPASQGKVTYSNLSRKSVEKFSPMEEITNQRTEPGKDLFEIFSEKRVGYLKESGNTLFEKSHESTKSIVSQGKVTNSSLSRKSLEKFSPREEISNKITEPMKDSFGIFSEKRILDDDQVTQSRIIKNVEDNLDIDEMFRKSPICCGEQTGSTNAEVDTLMNQKMEEASSVPNQQVQKNELGCDQIVRGDATTFSSLIDDLNVCQVSSSSQPETNNSKIVGGLISSDNELLHEKSSPEDDGFLARDTGKSLCFDGKYFTSDEIRQLEFLESSMQGRELRSAAENTWPQPKRRKIESHEINSVPAENSFGIKKSHNIGPNLGIVLDFERSQFSQVENAAESDASKIPDVELGPKILSQETESWPEIPIEQDELGCNQIVRADATTFSSLIDDSNVCQVSSSSRPEANNSIIDGGFISSDNVLLHEKSSLEDDGFLARDAGKSLCFNEKYFTSDEISQLKFLEESSMQGRKLRSAAENSWPQLKRRKIESQETNSVPAGISFSVKKSHIIGPNLGIALDFERSRSSHEDNAAKSDASKSSDVELGPKILSQETKTLREMPIEQDEIDFGDKTQRKRSPLFMQGEKSMSFATSSLNNKDAKDSTISFGLIAGTTDASSTLLDESTHGFKNDYKFENDILLQNKDDPTHSGKKNLETEPYFTEEGYDPSFSVPSPQDKNLTGRSSDQTMPEFEGFIIGKENSGETHIIGDALNNLDLPTTLVERATFLEHLCKSAVMHTPLYQFSAKRKFHRTPDVCQSVPILNLNNYGLKQFETSNSSEGVSKSAFQGLYPDKMLIFDNYYGQSLPIPPTSPVSKLWGRVSSESFSSEKKLNSNPELTCFRIEEDPSNSEEEEENKDEVTNLIKEDVCSESMDYVDKRNPLADITRENVIPTSSVYAAKTSRDISNLDSVDTEINFTGTHGGAKQKLSKLRGSKRIGINETKKKLTLSTSVNIMGNAKESLNNRLSKPNILRKTSLRNGGKSMSVRGSKINNIISNISSFVPLVQQKQAAAVITEKRDVKVKALEAAEAAKRLEEKKENERKLKKEALKLERARLEQENLRQAELNRKKKEDEVKKKEADVAARKRLREEEEKKERERKRRRFEGKRQKLREQEEKLRARKLEKKSPVCVVDTKLNSGPVIADALKPQKVKMDVDRGDGNNEKKSDTEFLPSKSLENDVRQSVLESFEAFGHSRFSTEVTNRSGEKSYDISPYQSSDNEDDEDDDEDSPRKFVPTWASKKALSLVVSSQQDINPYILFPRESFSCVDEVSGLGIYKKK